jgi:hypothetical protein
MVRRWQGIGGLRDQRDALGSHAGVQSLTWRGPIRRLGAVGKSSTRRAAYAVIGAVAGFIIAGLVGFAVCHRLDLVGWNGLAAAEQAK